MEGKYAPPPPSDAPRAPVGDFVWRIRPWNCWAKPPLCLRRARDEGVARLAASVCNANLPILPADTCPSANPSTLPNGIWPGTASPPLHAPHFDLEQRLAHHMDQDLKPLDSFGLSDVSDSEEDRPTPPPPLAAPYTPAPLATAPLPRPPGMADRRYKNHRRRIGRNAGRLEAQAGSGGHYKACAEKYKVIAAETPLPSSISPEEAVGTTATKPGWVGLRDKREAWRDWSLDELQERGIREVCWNGR